MRRQTPSEITRGGEVSSNWAPTGVMGGQRPLCRARAAGHPSPGRSAAGARAAVGVSRVALYRRKRVLPMSQVRTVSANAETENAGGRRRVPGAARREAALPLLEAAATAVTIVTVSAVIPSPLTTLQVRRGQTRERGTF